MDSIKEHMRFGNFSKALDDLISLVHEENFSSLTDILEGILEIQNTGHNLTKEQLQKIKPLLDVYDDNVLELTIDIYTNTLIKDMSLIDDEIELILSKVIDFEPIVRNKFVDFLITIFFKCSKYEKQIVRGLISCLSDELWKIRKKIVIFLNKLVSQRPFLIKEFDKELEVLFDDTDIDVIKESLDFLLRLFIETYSIEDIKYLIKTLPERDWFAQEKILFLTGKVGSVKKELIKPVLKDLVLLLDHDDFLINKTISKIIEEIMEYHVDLFDDTLFSFIRNDEIDNLEAIEQLIRFSIIKHGFERFNNLFTIITPLDESIIITFNNVIRKLYDDHPKFVESLFSQLIEEILKNLNISNYTKLRMILKPNPQYNIYLICYNALNKKEVLENPELEKLRKELVSFLYESIPELSFQNLQNWLDSKLKKGSVTFDEICDKFHIHKYQLLEILKTLLKNKMLNVIIFNDTLDLLKRAPTLKTDLFFLKSWKNIPSLEKLENYLLLSVQIKNVSSEKILNLNVFLDYPQDIFVKFENKEKSNKIPEILERDQRFMLNWLFQKRHDERFNTKSSTINLITIYQKQGKTFSMRKKLDILLI
ncbi:MAG: hypothetical protein ACFFCI_05750 [Promethearchaeota archaeon]